MAAHSRIIAWITPWTEDSGGPQCMGLQRVRHDWQACIPVSPYLFCPPPNNLLSTLFPESSILNTNLNDTIGQLDLIDIYRTLHPKTMNFDFLSSAHGTFSRIDHILGHKSSLGKFR